MKPFKSLIVMAALAIVVASCGTSRNTSSTPGNKNTGMYGNTDSSHTGTSGNTGDSTHQR